MTETRNSLPYVEHGSLKYTDPNRVKGIVYDTYRTFLNPYADGYGRKIPTPWRIDYLGKCMVKRHHRVYVMCYGYSGSAYINVGGNIVFLDSDTEHRLEEERDNVLAR